MRLVSSEASSRRGEVSVLAVVETIVASALSFWIAWRLGTIKHLVIASAFAPFLLLRSRLGAWLAARLGDRFGRRAQRIVPIYLVEDAVALLGIPAARLIATLYLLARRPLRMLAAVPGNFVRYVFVVDLTLAPQFISGLEETRYRGRTNDPCTIVRAIFADFVSGGAPKLLLLLTALIYVPAVLTSITFRWAIKSTAVLWLPLIWVVTRSRTRDVYARLKLATKGTFTKLMLAYSLFVMLSFVVKMAILYRLWRFPDLAGLGQLGTVATQLADPLRLPLWQVLSAFNAALSWAFFFHAEMLLLTRRTAEAWPKRWIRLEYGIVNATRSVITLYTIACTFYIAATVGWNLEWPKVDLIVFPWSN